MLIHGDCLEVMAGLPESSVDAIVTDPPYGLTFMGKAWDDLSRVPDHSGPQWGGYGWHGTGAAPGSVMQEWHQRWATEALRVAKPGAYLLAFGGTRTYHRLAVAIEDAGWIIRDCLVWAYAQGFPKSRALLKPAWEPIVMARKPGPLRELAIDACRLAPGAGISREGEPSAQTRYSNGGDSGFAATPGTRGGDAAGRWPANVLLTDAIFDGDVEGVVGGGETHSQSPETRGGFKTTEPFFGQGTPTTRGEGYGDSGTYSRFFLLPKADRAEREPLGYAGIERINKHPTVKSLDLMRHLVRLVTPTGGTCLDPFLGSGTTGIACEMEGFAWLGIEREEEYVKIAEARLQGVQKGLGLSA